MKKTTTKYFMIALATFLLFSCGRPVQPRTLYWSGTRMERKNDSLNTYSLYIEYYIEVSDTGGAKLMTHKIYKDTMLCYKIELSDRTKDRILKLAMDSTSCVEKKKDPNFCCIYDGLLYNLRIKSAGTDRKYSYIRPLGNQVQKELIVIMDSIFERHRIQSRTFLDLTEYQKSTEKDVLTRNPPPKLKGTIKFVTPVIKDY
jgi:hypothetical protein